ncbi:MAG: LLM class flavin-dependent oxidoreductase [Cycloclasticus sp.]
MSNLKLSVLDQSPVHDNQPESHGLFTTVELAKACDEAGYHRYWVAEHHDTPGYASPCPEMMVSNVAHATKRIRVGSGGVMLPHYAAFKVAETFKMLEAFHPGRIDVGVGRAPGGNPVSSGAISAPRQTIPPEYYPNQTQDLIGYLKNDLPSDHPFSKATVVPSDVAAPPVWMLGSSDGSAEMAGVLGAGFVLALFIGTHDRPPEIIQRYRDAFQTGGSLEKPEAIIAVASICADSKEEAEFIAASHTYWKVQAFRHGTRDALFPPEVVMDKKKQLSLSDQAYYDETLATMVTGTPAQCQSRLEQIADLYKVDELMIVNVTHSFAPRIESYKKLAAQFSLN